MKIPTTTTFQCPRDPNTLSNYHNFMTTHTTANFTIDFEHKRLTGNVVLTLKSITKAETQHLILDTSYLHVQQVEVDGATPKWELLSRFEPYGSALKIDLDKGVKFGKTVEVEIKLQTTKECTALQWLTPVQTSNGKHPYMFSQSQPIHARSIFPCQDTPDVKSTFDFHIRSPLPVIVSGLSTGTTDFEPGKNDSNGTLLYSFRQDIPIPSYLFAIASGDLAIASIGPRSLVATGPEEIVAAKWEFEADTERFLRAAEELVFPYAWTTYNVLVLPPSFPFGGMENPSWTHLTPSVVSYDRENVDVIAHELSHSWSGNLATNASWEHFWLNEGWTVYLERRIQAAIHGEAHRDFSAIIGWKALSDSIANFGEDHEFTKLIVDLKGKDPDDAFSSVPYEKGFTFLYYLEKLVGKEKWDRFIPHYFTTFAQKSLDSYEFKSTLLDFFASDPAASKSLSIIDWDTWFYAPGFPPKPDFDTSLVDVCYALATKWETLSDDSKTPGFQPSAADIDGWSANQIVVFLERLQLFEKPVRSEDVRVMGEEYGLSKSRNAEVLSRYFGVGLRARAREVYGPTAEFLGKIGRMKFCRPLYRQLNEADHDLAIQTFEAHRDFYHPICRNMVEKDLYGKD